MLDERPTQVNPRKLTIAPIDQVCEEVAAEGFDPWVKRDTQVHFQSNPPIYTIPDLSCDDGDIDYRAFFDFNFALKDRSNTRLVHLHNALVVPDVFAVIAAGDRFVFPNSYVEWDQNSIVKYYFHRSAMLYSVTRMAGVERSIHEYFLLDNVPEETVEEPHILLAHQSSINYYHLLSEIAPRLWIYDRYPTLKQCKVILQAPPDRNLSYFLERAGIDASRIVYLDPKRRYRFHHLILPSALDDMAPSREKFAFVRSHFPDLEERYPIPGRRYYLSRSDAKLRRIANEPQLVELLQEYGVETVFASTLSLEQQAAMFADAELMVGIYGAGLANMIFMSPGAAVVELACKGWDGGMWKFAGPMGLKFYSLMSSADLYAVNRTTPRTDNNPQAMEFDLNKLRLTLDRTLRYLNSR